MNPRTYLTAYLERVYGAHHPDLTPGARALVHDGILQRPEKYATDGHAQALLAYTQVHERLMRDLARLDDLPDDAFERKRAQIFDATRHDLLHIAATDRLCVDAQLVAILLADVGIDDCLGDLLKLEADVRDYLVGSVQGFDIDAPRFWNAQALSTEGATAGTLTRSEPVLVGWLHTLEAISQLCLASGRYRAATAYARLVMRADGYPNHAEGTIFLALARLEDEEGFFSFAQQLEKHSASDAGAIGRGDEEARENADASAPSLVDDSPWYLLGRTLLLYKLGRRRAARRALRDFAARCEGGAFFLLNPTYLTPYLPVRPEPTEPWGSTHQAVWEADGIIADTPDFVPWAESVEGIFDSSEAFADRYGF